MNIKKTANLLLNFMIKRLAEILGIILFFGGALLLIALLTYSPEDPNFIFPKNMEIENILGFQGSFTSDLFFQAIGLISYLISITIIISGINIIRTKEFFLLIENIFFWHYRICTHCSLPKNNNFLGLHELCHSKVC